MPIIEIRYYAESCGAPTLPVARRAALSGGIAAAAAKKWVADIQSHIADPDCFLATLGFAFVAHRA